MIKRFLSRNIHWLLFICVLINMVISLTTFTKSKEDIIAIIFGIIGLFGVSYLAFYVESEKRRKENGKG